MQKWSKMCKQPVRPLILYVVQSAFFHRQFVCSNFLNPGSSSTLCSSNRNPRSRFDTVTQTEVHCRNSLPKTIHAAGLFCSTTHAKIQLTRDSGHPTTPQEWSHHRTVGQTQFPNQVCLPATPQQQFNNMSCQRFKLSNLNEITMNVVNRVNSATWLTFFPLSP